MSAPTAWSRAARRLRRAVLARRRPLAAVAAMLAVGAALRSVSPPPDPVETMVVAARDLPGGAVLAEGDLVEREVPPDVVPVGAVTTARDVIGRTTAAPLRPGEPVTDVRLLGPGLLDGYPGTVAAPVRIGDAAAAGLVRVGDRVDLLAADPQGGGAEVLVRSVPVVALPAADETGLQSGRLVVVAVPAAAARRLAGAGVSSYVSLVLAR